MLDEALSPPTSPSAGSYKKYSKQHYKHLLNQLKGLEQEYSEYNNHDDEETESSSIQSPSISALRRHKTSSHISSSPQPDTAVGRFLNVGTPTSARSLSASRERSARSTASSTSSSLYTVQSSKKNSNTSTRSSKATTKRKKIRGTPRGRPISPASKYSTSKKKSSSSSTSKGKKKKSSKYQKQLILYKSLCNTELKARDMLLSITFAEMENQLALFRLQAEILRWKRENPKMKPGHSVEAMEAQMRQLSKKRWEPRYERVVKKLEYAVEKRVKIEKKYLSGVNGRLFVEASAYPDEHLLTTAHLSVPLETDHHAALYSDDEMPKSPKSKKRFTKFVTSLNRKMELHLLQVKHRILQYQYQHSQSKQKQRELILEETMSSLSSAYLFMNKKRLVNKMSALSEQHTRWLSEARGMCQTMIDLPRKIPEFGDSKSTTGSFPSDMFENGDDEEEVQSVDQAAPVVPGSVGGKDAGFHQQDAESAPSTPAEMYVSGTTFGGSDDDSALTPTSPTESMGSSTTMTTANTPVLSTSTNTNTATRIRPVIPALSLDFPTPTKDSPEDLSISFSAQSLRSHERQNSLNTILSMESGSVGEVSDATSQLQHEYPLKTPSRHSKSARASMLNRGGSQSSRARYATSAGSPTDSTYPASHSTATTVSQVHLSGSQSARYRHHRDSSASVRLLSQEKLRRVQNHVNNSASPRILSTTNRRLSQKIRPENLMKLVDELRNQSSSAAKTHTSHPARQQKSRSSRNLLEVSEAPHSKPLFRPRSTPRKRENIQSSLTPSPLQQQVIRKNSTPVPTQLSQSPDVQLSPAQSTIASPMRADHILETSTELLQDVSSFLSCYRSPPPLVRSSGMTAKNNSAHSRGNKPGSLERRESYVDLHKHPSFKNKMKRHKTYTNVKDVQFEPDTNDQEWYESKMSELNSLREKLQTETLSPR